MGAVRRAMDEGLVGHLGFATHAPLETIVRAIETREFESVNLHYYFINPRNLPAVRLAASLDMGVFIISPTDKGGQLHMPPARLESLCRPLTPIEYNQRWLLSQHEVHTLSVGASTPDEFDAHLVGVGRAGPLTDDETAIASRLETALGDLGSTYCSVCHECLPCPEDVHIPEILRLRNLAVAYDMVEFGRYRYGMFVRRDPSTGERTGGAGHWFPGAQAEWCSDCGDCLPRCPLGLDIPALLREAHGVLSGTAGKRLWK
jgi:predicted aldo/keto reductase-like oxidoreductase